MKIFFTLFALLFVFTANAQQKNTADSLHNDTLHLTEQQLLQQQQQNKVDELVKNKLEKQIQLLEGTASKEENWNVNCAILPFATVCLQKNRKLK